MAQIRCAPYRQAAHVIRMSQGVHRFLRHHPVYQRCEGCYWTKRAQTADAVSHAAWDLCQGRGCASTRDVVAACAKTPSFLPANRAPLQLEAEAGLLAARPEAISISMARKDSSWNSTGARLPAAESFRKTTAAFGQLRVPRYVRGPGNFQLRTRHPKPGTPAGRLLRCSLPCEELSLTGPSTHCRKPLPEVRLVRLL